MTSYSLILVHQPGCQDIKDFEAIGAFAREQDPEVEIFIAHNNNRSPIVRKKAARYPSLTFSPGQLDEFRPARGRVYAGGPISKLIQMRRFVECGIPVPDFAELSADFEEAPESFGPLVLVKGTTIHASRNVGTTLCRREAVRWQPAASYPEDHPGRHGPMFVQRFIDTGLYPSHYRVLTLFGEPLLAYKNTSLVPRCSLDAPSEALSKTVIRASRKTGQSKELVFADDVLSFARNTYRAFPEVPLQACDILREFGTGRLYLLEINPGANTWSFSRERTPEVLKELGVDSLTTQFDAFRTAARLLIDRTRSEAF